MIIDFITRQSKNGKTYGRLTLEDKTGTQEIMLFGKNFVDFNKYGIKGEFILIRGAYKLREYKKDAPAEFQISSIEMLHDLKGKMIHNIEIDVIPSEMTSSVSKMLMSFLTSSTENQSELTFNIIDPGTNKGIRLVSKHLMPVTKELLSYLDELGWNYRIEGRENPDRKLRDADYGVEEKENEMVEVDD